MAITSVDIRDDLWQKAKILAIKRKVSLKDIINEALELYLKRKEGRKESE